MGKKDVDLHCVYNLTERVVPCPVGKSVTPVNCTRSVCPERGLTTWF